METFFGDVFLIKTSKQTGPKSQSSAWRKGSRTCKPTEAKSTWRKEKTVKLFVVKARNFWIVTLFPPGSIQKMLKLQWHGRTGMIVSQPGGIPATHTTCKCWGRSSSSANNVKTSAKSPCSNSCRELMFWLQVVFVWPLYVGNFPKASPLFQWVI